MSKKTKKPEYAESPYEPWEYVLAWIAAGNEIDKSGPFGLHHWLESMTINSLHFSPSFIRECHRIAYTYGPGHELYGLAIETFCDEKKYRHEQRVKIRNDNSEESNKEEEENG